MPMIPLRESKFSADCPMVRESDHYRIFLKRPNGIPANHEAPNFFLVSKEFDTVEAASAAYVTICMYMQEAERAYDAVMDNFDDPEPQATPIKGTKSLQ